MVNNCLEIANLFFKRVLTYGRGVVIVRKVTLKANRGIIDSEIWSK